MAKAKVFLKEADLLFGDLLMDMEKILLWNLKRFNPVDDTTRDKAYELYQSTGHWAWEKDSKVSANMWKTYRLVRSGEGVTLRIINNSGYIQHLVEGFVTVDPQWSNLFAVERTADGQFSEQNPTGDFVDRALVETLLKFDYTVKDKGKFGGGGV